MHYLLDTNAWIVYLKGRQTNIRSRLEETPKDQITTCSVVRAELLHGARKYENSADRRERVEKLLGSLENFDFVSRLRGDARTRVVPWKKRGCSLA